MVQLFNPETQFTNQNENNTTAVGGIPGAVSPPPPVPTVVTRAILPVTESIAPIISPPRSPSITLIQPFKQPDNSILASSINDCFSVSPNVTSWAYSYDVGSDAQPQKRTITVFNKMITNSLFSVIAAPSFLSVDGDVSRIIPPRGSTSYVVTVDATGSIDLLLLGNTFFTEDLTITCEAVGVSGPIFVMKN